MTEAERDERLGSLLIWVEEMQTDQEAGDRDRGVNVMGRMIDRVWARGMVYIFILSIGMFALPEKVIGGGSGSGLAGQPHRIQDQEKMQKALYGLFQKAKSQQVRMENWHRQARTGKTKAVAQNRRSGAQGSGVNDAWRKLCDVRLAMTETTIKVSNPVSMRVLDSCPAGTNLPLSRK